MQGITQPSGHGLFRVPSPVPLSTPSPRIHRRAFLPVPCLSFCPQALRTHRQGSLWPLAVSLGHLQLPSPCLGERAGGKKG